MRNNNVVDEREINVRRKIGSDAFTILMFILLLSTLVKQFVFKTPPENYAVEIASFVIMSFYVVLRNIASGLSIYGNEKKSKYIPILNSLVTALTVTVVIGIQNYLQYSSRYQGGDVLGVLAVTFISAFLGTYIVMTLFASMNKAKQERIKSKLDEEENE
ncbi:MAG: hypothetical protein QMB63_08335 [Clostridiaceae bacterium]